MPMGPLNFNWRFPGFHFLTKGLSVLAYSEELGKDITMKVWEVIQWHIGSKTVLQIVDIGHSFCTKPYFVLLKW